MSRYGSAQIRSTDFAGEVLTPGMDGYAEAAATVFATGTPDVVVRPADAGEVAAALRYAAEGGLTVSVRSGGHSVAGLSTHADGMVIDLRRISRVEVIDQATRRVRIGAGATWGAVAAALQPHGLGITAGDTNQVGVGGLTLGGGIGWMVRRYGLAIDSLAGATWSRPTGGCCTPAPITTATCSGRCAAGAATSASSSASTSSPSQSPRFTTA